MCAILRWHLKNENKRLEAEAKSGKRLVGEDVRGDGTDVPMVLGSRGFRYML
jgi:hypothetical protein